MLQKYMYFKPIFMIILIELLSDLYVGESCENIFLVSTLLPRLTVHTPLSGFLRIWAFKNDKKSDPLKGACTDTRISVHALLCGGHLMRGKWVDIKFV